jgi:hypothetical protein
MTTMTAPRPFVQRRRWTTVAAALVVVLIVGMVWIRHSSGPFRPPYTDSAATGHIGLCDTHSKSITSGSVTDKPFVWRAVGSTAAGASNRGAGRTATLYAFQPRRGVDPSGWSGEQLTSSGQYTNVNHPMAQATSADIDLQDFLTAYPAKLSGLVQLRLYLGAPDQPLSTTHYDATDIRVSGTKWSVVGGTSVTCTDGRSVSLETQLGTNP